MVSDTHGDKIDPGAAAAFHAFCKSWKPETRWHLGDAWDFRFLRKKAGDEEKREPVQDDLDAGIEFLKTYKPTGFLFGNHDARCQDAAEGDNGPLADFARRMLDEITDALGGAQTFPYDKRAGVGRLGNLSLVHGYGAGINATRAHTLVYNSMLMGHCHSIDVAVVPGLEPRVGRQIGCLCSLSMPYCRATMSTLRQAHGFAYGLLFPDGKTIVWQAERVGGEFFLPSEVREFSAAKPA